MFTLLKVSNADATKGIYHARKNGDFVQELSRKDAVLTYEVTDRSSNYFGQKYAFFIILCEEGDILKWRNASKAIVFNRTEYEIFYDAVHINEMCRELVNQGKPFPTTFEFLLSDSLMIFFQKVIQWESKGYDSAATWQYYEAILEYICKKADDFVDSSVIDKFIRELCDIHDVQV